LRLVIWPGVEPSRQQPSGRRLFYWPISHWNGINLVSVIDAHLGVSVMLNDLPLAVSQPTGYAVAVPSHTQGRMDD
jgi:hypothetical protein